MKEKKAGVLSLNTLIKIWFPLVFTVAMAASFFIFGSGYKVVEHGILPRTFSGLQGILFAPFIHGDINHLFSNTLPMLVMGSILFTVYKDMAYRVFIAIYVFSSVLVWVFGRENYHIGASGVVYGLWGFILFSGFMRRRRDLVVFSFLIAFLYGGMFWGLFPIDMTISFEAHIGGVTTGAICALLFIDVGPREKKYFEDEVDEPDDPNAPWNDVPDEEKEKV